MTKIKRKHKKVDRTAKKYYLPQANKTEKCGFCLPAKTALFMYKSVQA